MRSSSSASDHPFTKRHSAISVPAREEGWRCVVVVDLVVVAFACFRDDLTEYASAGAGREAIDEVRPRVRLHRFTERLEAQQLHAAAGPGNAADMENHVTARVPVRAKGDPAG